MLDSREIHEQRRNLSLIAKEKQQLLTGHEWLTDLDIHQALVKMGLRSAVSVCSLNSEIEHGYPPIVSEVVRRLSILTAIPEAPVEVPFIVSLGVGSSGQGIHWVNVNISIDIQNKRIQVQAQDDLYSETQLKEIAAAVQQQFQLSMSTAVVDERLDTVMQPSPCLAVTDYQVDVLPHVKEDVQLDGWSCGYRALAKVAKSSLDAPSDATGYDGGNLRTALKHAKTSADLRDAVYGSLLPQRVEVDAVHVNQSAVITPVAYRYNAHCEGYRRLAVDISHELAMTSVPRYEQFDTDGVELERVQAIRVDAETKFEIELRNELEGTISPTDFKIINIEENFQVEDDEKFSRALQAQYSLNPEIDDATAIANAKEALEQEDKASAARINIMSKYRK